MEKSQYAELKAQQSIHWWFVGKKEIVLDFARVHANLKEDCKNTILDVGCGMGLMIECLQKYGQVFGVDMEPDAVCYCNECMLSQGFNAKVLEGALPDRIPFPDQTFDYIFALDVLEHIREDNEALKKLFSLLRPGGWLVLTVPALMSMWSYNDELNHHFRRYEKEELIFKTEQAGFQVEKCSYYNCFLFAPAWFVRKVKNIFRIRTSDVYGKAKKSFINSLLSTIFISEKYCLRKNSFPIGVSLITACQRPL